MISTLPSESDRAEPPEGDAHRVPKVKALDALSEYYRRIRRGIYLSAELPVYYPGEPMFAPDLLAVLEVEVHERNCWVVSHEGRGLDLCLEIHVAGSAKKDFEATSSTTRGWGSANTSPSMFRESACSVGICPRPNRSATTRSFHKRSVGHHVCSSSTSPSSPGDFDSTTARLLF